VCSYEFKENRNEDLKEGRCLEIKWFSLCTEGCYPLSLEGKYTFIPIDESRISEIGSTEKYK
jgi:hypothetical protein